MEVVRDTASGFTLDRPGITRVRELLREEAGDIVVSYAVDRLARNQNHIGVLFDGVQQAGAQLEFVTEKFEDTAIGRFILAARAFIGEVEREKIIERTTRGKLERARSGRIPGATGAGCYGYIYSRDTGRRELEPFQAEVVRRMFQRYAETRSFGAVAQELNEAGIPSFAGGRWYVQTVRRVLHNESYAGRFVYRRTRKTVIRNGGQGSRRRDVQQSPEQWIVIDGASPRIIDEALWQRVQDILKDPERVPHRRTARFYPLRGRARCGLCGTAMVGQTISVPGRPYRYYRCRHIYDKNTSRSCSARFVPADELEAGIWREVKKVLASPAVVFQELEQRSKPETDGEEVARLEQELSALTERERRLARLYTYGEVDENVIREEGTHLQRQRILLQERLGSLRGSAAVTIQQVDPEGLAKTCAAVADWLDGAGERDRTLVLEALQVAVTGTRESTTVTGVLPVDSPPFLTGKRSSRRR